jgi:hypothetical protein
MIKHFANDTNINNFLGRHNIVKSKEHRARNSKCEGEIQKATSTHLTLNMAIIPW